MQVFKIANLNAYNLVRAGVPFYDQPAYGVDELEQKLQWTAGILRASNADLVGFQEVFHEETLQDAVAQAGDGFDVRAPGATRELNEAGGKALGPKLGLASRFPVVSLDVIFDFPAEAQLTVPILHPDTQAETLVEPPRVYRRVKHSKDEPYVKAEIHPRLSGRASRTRCSAFPREPWRLCQRRGRLQGDRAEAWLFAR